MSSVTELFEEIVARLESSADPEWAKGQRAFFRHEVRTRGVRMSALSPVIREAARRIKPWPPSDRNALMKLLWETGQLEDGALACHVYRRFARSCAACEFKLFERWIDRYVRNWAHCDGVGTFLVSACLANEPDLRFELRGWARSKNRWKRRAAAVSLIHEAKNGRHTEFIFEIAAALLPDRDDMVEKGAGWLLKESYPARSKETLEFLLAHRRLASRLTLRYAAEKMSPADRAQVMVRAVAH